MRINEEYLRSVGEISAPDEVTEGADEIPWATFCALSLDEKIEHLRKGRELLKPVRARDPEWIRYRRAAWDITKKQPIHILAGYDKRGFKGYHLDHILSIWEAWKMGLPPEVVGDISNLRMIPWVENMRKGRSTVYTDLFGATI